MKDPRRLDEGETGESGSEHRWSLLFYLGSYATTDTFEKSRNYD